MMTLTFPFLFFIVIMCGTIEQVCPFVTPLLLRTPGLSDTSKLTNLYVRCDKGGLVVSLKFDKPFNGIVYSIGHNNMPECSYVALPNVGQLSYEFLIPVNKCGTEGQYRDPKPGEKVSIKNTIIVQHDPDFMTAEDTARALSCTWSDSYAKPISSKPIQVEETNVVPIVLKSQQEAKAHDEFLPEYNVASGLLQSDSDKSVLITLMDPFNQYDATVLDCLAYDRSGSFAVALTDKNGCMLQLKVMPPFKKTRDVGVGLTLTSSIKDQRLAQNKNLAVKCNIQICPGRCPEPCLYSGTKSKSLVKAFQA